MLCLHCQQETTNPKFCSSKCSTIHNNQIKPKRKLKIILCKACNTPIDRKNTTDRRTYCEACKPTIFDSKTIGDVITGKKHARSTYNTIRHRARVVIKLFYVKECSVCKYTKHVEVCHIRPIHTFPLDTLISTVNSMNNLIYLCPNHHWELDHNLLDL